MLTPATGRSCERRFRDTPEQLLYCRANRKRMSPPVSILPTPCTPPPRGPVRVYPTIATSDACDSQSRLHVSRSLRQDDGRFSNWGHVHREQYWSARRCFEWWQPCWFRAAAQFLSGSLLLVVARACVRSTGLTRCGTRLRAACVDRTNPWYADEVLLPQCHRCLGRKRARGSTPARATS